MKTGRRATSYTNITVVVELENGAIYRYGWSTPIAMMPALHKAPRWARVEMTKAGVRGRSRIRVFGVDAETIEGRLGK